MTAESDTDALLDLAAAGDADARNRLFHRHRRRLRQVVALRLAARLRARVDPSDIVQDSLADADRKFDGYLHARPLPFFLWLRQLALERVAEAHRRHVKARCRSVDREAAAVDDLPEDAVGELVGRLADDGTSQGARLEREEARQRVLAALGRLSERDREVLVLRYLEQLSVAEAAVVLGVSEGAVKVRHVRALRRIAAELEGEEPT